MPLDSSKRLYVCLADLLVEGKPNIGRGRETMPSDMEKVGHRNSRVVLRRRSVVFRTMNTWVTRVRSVSFVPSDDPIHIPHLRGPDGNFGIHFGPAILLLRYKNSLHRLAPVVGYWPRARLLSPKPQ